MQCDTHEEDILHHPGVAAITNVVLDHHIFDGTSGWRRAESRAQPSLQLAVSVNASDYGHLGMPRGEIILHYCHY